MADGRLLVALMEVEPGYWVWRLGREAPLLDDDRHVGSHVTWLDGSVVQRSYEELMRAGPPSHWRATRLVAQASSTAAGEDARDGS